MTLKAKTLSINVCDTGDNHLISYKISSRTTKGLTAGWYLVEILDETFEQEFTFGYNMIDKFIEALTEMKKFLNEPD